MSSYIELFKPQYDLYTKIDYDPAKFEEIKRKVYSRPSIDPFHATLVTVRTNNAMNFCKDFFAPTLVNIALKIDGLFWERVFVCFAAFVIDMITLASRILTIAPQAIANTQLFEHPLLTLMKAKGVDPRFYEDDYVKANLFHENVCVSRKEYYNLIELPG